MQAQVQTGALQFFWMTSLLSEMWLLLVRLNVGTRRFPVFSSYLAVDILISCGMFVVHSSYPEYYRTLFNGLGPLMSMLLLVVCLETIYRMEEHVNLGIINWLLCGGTALLGGGIAVFLLDDPRLHLGGAVFSFKRALAFTPSLFMLSYVTTHLFHCHRKCLYAAHALILATYLCLHALVYFLAASVDVSVVMMVMSTLCWTMWTFVWLQNSGLD
jgi:hypothetical protein